MTTIPGYKKGYVFSGDMGYPVIDYLDRFGERVDAREDAETLAVNIDGVVQFAPAHACVLVTIH